MDFVCWNYCGIQEKCFSNSRKNLTAFEKFAQKGRSLGDINWCDCKRVHILLL